MQRKIFSINRISKVRGDFNKSLALISLALGTACMQIMLSPTVAQASDSRISPESTATSDAFFNGLFGWISTIFTIFLCSIPVFLILGVLVGSIGTGNNKELTEVQRFARENKIRDFKNRYGREPNSWEI
jgi:hypothetical protein